MKRFKLSLAAAALAASATLAACGNGAPSNTAANTSNTSNANASANANAAAQATPAATPAANAGADEFAIARTDYQNFCVKCHKEDGSGGVFEEDGQKYKAPNFRAEKHTEEQFIRKISNGDADEGMPPFKNRLDPERIAGLARLILREFPAGSAASPNAGKASAPAH